VNKYIVIIILVVLLLAGGVLYRVFFLSETDKPVVTGNVREFTIIAKKDEWRFIPEEIEVQRGDKVVLTVVNEDDYDHGIGIDAFGISQRMPANETIIVEFTATQPGEFQYYCSVPCGEGEVEGKTRGHFDMIGNIRVRDVVKTE
jgi:plastocyanin